MKYNKIALIGMMGSGKTTVAKAFSNLVNIDLFDSDELFEKKYNIKITDFFSKFGEIEFRKCETSILIDIAKKNNFILSTGGGIILSQSNRDILFSGDIYTIYLSATVDTLYDRVKNNSSRPLLNVDNPKYEIEKILDTRIKYYNMANQIVKTDGKNINEIIKEIQCIL